MPRLNTQCSVLLITSHHHSSIYLSKFQFLFVLSLDEFLILIHYDYVHLGLFFFYRSHQCQ